MGKTKLKLEIEIEVEWNKKEVMEHFDIDKEDWNGFDVDKDVRFTVGEVSENDFFIEFDEIALSPYGPVKEDSWKIKKVTL